MGGIFSKCSSLPQGGVTEHQPAERIDEAAAAIAKNLSPDPKGSATSQVNLSLVCLPIGRKFVSQECSIMLGGISNLSSSHFRYTSILLGYCTPIDLARIDEGLMYFLSGIKDYTLSQIEMSPKYNITIKVGSKTRGINTGYLATKERREGKIQSITYGGSWLIKPMVAGREHKTFNDFVYGNIVNYISPGSGTKIRLSKSPTGEISFATKIIPNFNDLYDCRNQPGFKELYAYLAPEILAQSILIGDVDFLLPNFGISRLPNNAYTFNNIDFDKAGNFFHHTLFGKDTKYIEAGSMFNYIY